MKQLKCLLLVAAVALSIAGCQKTVDVSFEKSTQEVDVQGGSVEIALKSNGEWTINPTEDWITVSPMSGNGDATLTLTAAANTTQESRSTEITATTKDNTSTLTVFQEAPEFYLTVTPKEIRCGSDGGEFTITVSSNVDWLVTLPQWITSSVTEGSNDATVTLTVSPLTDDVDLRTDDVVFGNPLGSVGTITIADQVHVIQQADPVLGIEITPGSLRYVCTGETKTVGVITEDAWTASVEEGWVTLSQTEGQGDAELSVTVGENPIYVDRQTTVYFTTAGGVQAILIVHQEASPDPHFLEASPLEFVFGKEGGERTITIGCDTDWQFDLDFDWLSLSQMSGTGNAEVVLTAEPNTVTEPRNVEFHIKSGQLSCSFTVSQEAGDSPLMASIEPDSVFVTYAGGLQHVELTSNTTWQLQASSWIGFTTVTSGNGDASFDIIIDSQADPEERIGFLNVVHNGQVLCSMVVVQEGKPNLLETDITQLDVRPEGGDYIIQVTSNQEWTVMTGETWLHCNPTSGFANGSFTITVDEMPSPRPRTGIVKVSGSQGASVIITVDQH